MKHVLRNSLYPFLKPNFRTLDIGAA